MNVKIKILLFSFLITIFDLKCQTVNHVFKIDDLLYSIKSKDTLYVVNFWATWCKPCIAELPAFDSLYIRIQNQKVKIILVSLDFAENISGKVNPFLIKNKIKSTVVLLDEINGNDFITKISKNWSGSIPATLFKKGKETVLLEKKLRLTDLQIQIDKLLNKQ